MKNKFFYPVIILIIISSGLFWYWMFQNPTSAGASGEEGIEITMYRGDGCDCCLKWADHLEMNGFSVKDESVENLLEIKSRQKVPADLASCHTAVIDGYVVEGHVPAREIHRMLDERPEAAGISVPGMPMGSPGMEGFRTESYEVILFDENGSKSVYARY